MHVGNRNVSINLFHDELEDNWRPQEEIVRTALDVVKELMAA